MMNFDVPSLFMYCENLRNVDLRLNRILLILFFTLTFTNAPLLFADEETDPIRGNDLPASDTSGFKALGSDLGQNFSNLFSTKNLKPLLVLCAATSAAFTLDHEAREVLENGNFSDAFSNIGHQFGKPYTVGASLGTLYLIGLGTDDHKLKSVAYDLVQGYIMEAAIVMPIKLAVGRQRPDGSDQLSFPSGHTSTAFLWATVLDHHYGHKVGIPAYLGATYVAASRIKKNVHFFSDVVAGAGIGYLIGRSVTHKNSDDEKLLWIPTVTRLPRGGVNVEVSLLF